MTAKPANCKQCVWPESGVTHVHVLKRGPQQLAGLARFPEVVDNSQALGCCGSLDSPSENGANCPHMGTQSPSIGPPSTGHWACDFAVR